MENMTMRWIALLLIAITFRCCAYNVIDGQKLPPVIRYSCSPELEAEFLKQFAKWNAALGNYFTLQEAKDGENPDLLVATTSRSEERHPKWHAWTATLGKRATIDIKWPVKAHISLGHLMLHEIGHALGLGHSEKTLIMARDTYPYEEFTDLEADDIRGVKEIYLHKRDDE